MHYIDYSEFFSQKNLKACISLREKNYAIKENRNQFIMQLELDPSIFIFPNQTHSNNVKIINKSKSYSDTDAIITTSPDFGLGILIADCIPVFLYNINTNHFALVHSGWRGAANKITSITLKKMIEIGNNPRNIKAVVGPSIGKCCFEIGEEVSGLFDSKHLLSKGQSKYYLDIKQSIHEELISIGLNKKYIFIDSNCTFCEENKFFSYRREGKSSGRMMAIMGWENK